MEPEQQAQAVVGCKDLWIAGNGFVDGTHENPVVCIDYHIVINDIRYDIRATYTPTKDERERFLEIDDLSDFGYAPDRIEHRVMWDDDDGDHQEYI